MTLKFKLVLRAVDEEIDFEDEYTADYQIDKFREYNEHLFDEIEYYRDIMEDSHYDALVKAKKHLKIVYH